MLDQLFLPLHLDISKIVYQWVKACCGGGGRKGEGEGQEVNKYFVFEIASGTTRLKEWLRIPKNDSFTSFINHILKIGFKVCNITTQLFLCNANKFTRMFFQMFNYEGIELNYIPTKGRVYYQWNCIVVHMFLDDWVDQRPWIGNCSNQDQRCSVCWPISMILGNCPFQTWGMFCWVSEIST